MSAWRFHSFTALTCEIFFNTQREIHISVQPCNILYIYKQEQLNKCFIPIVNWTNLTSLFFFLNTCKQSIIMAQIHTYYQIRNMYVYAQF